MDFMNLNQSAHGDREYGFIGARLRMDRKIVVGYWQDPEVADELAGWARAALALAESRRLKIARFGGMNMREVAVTGGDRVEAQIQLGWSINGYGVGDLVGRIAEVSDAEVDRLVQEYEASYTLAAPLRKGGDRRENLRDAARQEIAMRAFLEAGGFGAFTTTFEDLHGLKQLPGLACQRLMAEGYGFGAEGDWKTAALVRLVQGDDGRAPRRRVLHGGLHVPSGEGEGAGARGAHARGLPLHRRRQAVAGGPPAGHRRQGRSRAAWCSTRRPGPAVNATLVDMGGRMRMIVAELDVVKPEHPMPKLPVARAVWIPRPDFKRGCQAWIEAGRRAPRRVLPGGHRRASGRTSRGWPASRWCGSARTWISHALRNELRWNDLAFKLGR